MDLPQDLLLPLLSGATWWYWLGGRPAIDFVNTYRERWWRNVETLVTPDDLSQWLTQARLLEHPAFAREDQLQAARQLREAINDGVQAAVEHRATSPAVIAEINRWLPESPELEELQLDEAGQLALAPAAPSDPVQHAIAVLAQDAAALLGTRQRDRLRICASETCSARFYDASRAATRRWCSMSACGNVAKARRHRAEHPTQPVLTTRSDD
jgi:predicted RNA-binding Zn ribbon-like protein